MRYVEVIQQRRYNTKQYRYYYTVVDSITKERLFTETTQSATLLEIVKKGYTLKPNA